MKIRKISLVKEQTDMTAKIFTLVPVLAIIIAFANCSSFKQDNPMDTSGTSWHPPTISAMGDTTAWAGDNVRLHANASAENGSIKSFTWSFGNDSIVNTITGILTTIFSLPGVQTIFVKAFDNDSIPSTTDTIKITVKPKLAVSTMSISLGTDSTSATFAITNLGPGTIRWTITTDTNWLTVSPTSGSTSTSQSVIKVTANRNNLLPGNHSGTITVMAGSDSRVITVTLSKVVYNYTFLDSTDARMQVWINNVLCDTIFPCYLSGTLAIQADCSRAQGRMLV